MKRRETGGSRGAFRVSPSDFDFALAWKRAKIDQKERVFIQHPFEVGLIEQDAESWLDSLRTAVNSGSYRPSPAYICDVPKGRGVVRPATHLTMADQVVYSACVGALLPRIQNAVELPGERIDFSNSLFPLDPVEPDWIGDRFKNWQDFRTSSLQFLEQRATEFVVTTDIAAFYENVDHEILVSDLRQCGAPEDSLGLLTKCLSRWGVLHGRGLPQGHTPSDILAKLYLNSTDRILKDLGYRHLRYVDDFRIFCSSQPNAKRALVELSRSLRNRGLCLQSAKTDILLPEEAKVVIEGVASIIARIRGRHEYSYRTFVFEDYDTPIRVKVPVRVSTDEPTEAPSAVLHEVYHTYFEERTSVNYDKSLFRFLLNQLGKRNDTYARDHSIGMLDEHPEETHAILQYASATGGLLDVGEQLAERLRRAVSTYHYQAYEIVWCYSTALQDCSKSILRVVREIAFDNSMPHYLRAVCRKYLGEHGSPTDLERLLNAYPEATSEQERSELICSLRRLERTRRNSFFAQSKADGEMVSRAVRWAKNNAASTKASVRKR